MQSQRTSKWWASHIACQPRPWRTWQERHPALHLEVSKAKVGPSLSLTWNVLKCKHETKDILDWESHLFLSKVYLQPQSLNEGDISNPPFLAGVNCITYWIWHRKNESGGYETYWKQLKKNVQTGELGMSFARVIGVLPVFTFSANRAINQMTRASRGFDRLNTSAKAHRIPYVRVCWSYWSYVAATAGIGFAVSGSLRTDKAAMQLKSRLDASDPSFETMKQKALEVGGANQVYCGRSLDGYGEVQAVRRVGERSDKYQDGR